MGKKRKHQGDPDSMFQEKKPKGQSRRKRRKLNSEAEKPKNQKRPATKIIEETSVPFTAHQDEIDVPTTSASFLQKLDPSELSIIPTRSVRRNAKSKKTEEHVPEYEKVARTTKDWENAAETSKMPTRDVSTGKLEKSNKKQTTSSELLKDAQQRVKDRAQLQQQYKKLENENEKKLSAAKQKRKEEARFNNQLKEISSTTIDLSRVPDLLRVGWKDVQDSPVSSQNYLQQVKEYIASIASTIVENPQQNSKLLLDLEIVCKYYPRLFKKLPVHKRGKEIERDPDEIKPNAVTADMFTTIRQLGVLSLVAVLNDITPGYRVRGDNEDIRTQPLKKSVKDVRMFEYAILSSYNRFLDFIEHQLQQKRLVKVCANALCQLLNANYHFNCRERLMKLLVPFMNAEDSQIATVCTESIAKLFQTDELGEASQEAVRFIMQYIKTKSYNVRPEMVDVFLQLKFTQDLSDSLRGGLSGSTLNKKAYQKLSGNKKKLHRHEKELERDLQDAAAVENKKLMTHYQAEILKSVFSLYFRVLKMESRISLLDPVLRGLAKFAHMINLEFQTDLFKALRQLMAHDDCSVQTILQSAITAFENLQMHGNTIDIDLKDFYERVYEILLDVPKEIEAIPNLLHCIRLMISNNRNLDINRVAAYAKRLATICFALPTNAALSVIITIQRLLQTFPAIRQLLDAVEDKSASSYNPYVHQPDTCNAMATSFWEFSLLEAHYHPTVSERAAATADAQGTQLIPLEVLSQFDTSKGGFNPSITRPKPHSFEQVMKNAPNSKCYLNVSGTSPMVDLVPSEGPNDAKDLFTECFLKAKEFNSQLERETLKQQLHHYQALLKRYLEYDPQNK